jgi:hypothetical protein
MKLSRARQILVSCLCLAWLLAACDSNEDEDGVSNTDHVVSQEFIYGIEYDNQKSLTLQGINGQIEILGVPDTNAVWIGGERSVGSESIEDARQHLHLLEVEVEQVGDAVQVHTIQPEDSSGRSYVVDYDITMPPEMAIVVSHVNGEVEISEIHGSVAVSVINGRIDLTVGSEMGPSVGLALVNGVVMVDLPASGSADIEAEIINGTISVSDLDVTDSDPSSNRFEGVLGDGGPALGISVINGQILIEGY